MDRTQSIMDARAVAFLCPEKAFFPLACLKKTSVLVIVFFSGNYNHWTCTWQFLLSWGYLLWIDRKKPYFFWRDANFKFLFLFVTPIDCALMHFCMFVSFKQMRLKKTCILPCRVQKVNDTCAASQLELSSLQKTDTQISARFSESDVQNANLNVTGKS